MNENVKKMLWGIFAVVLVIVGIVWFVNDDLEHIEDTNGADDYSLTTITDDQIINKSMGSMGFSKTERKSLLSNGTVEFSSKKFTGVYEVFYSNYIGKADFELHLDNFVVNEGNFKMVVVNDNKIVATIEPGTTIDYRLEDVTGTVSLIVAGESANFTFSMSKFDYDCFAHD